MRVSAQVMRENHDRVVREASRLFRERGVQGTSVADAMQAAGLTHGGFYRHFGSKDELVAAALAAAFDSFALALEQHARTAPPDVLRAEFRRQYLSREHVARPGEGCPMPALAGELARGEPAVREAFGAGLDRMVSAWASAAAEAPAGAAPGARAAAIRELATLVGAVALARACPEALRDEVLAACRR